MTFFYIITVLFFLLSCSIYLVSITKRRFEEVMPIIIPLIIFILYLFGICSALKIGFYAVNFFIVILLFISFFIIKQNLHLFVKNFFSPGLLLYIIWTFAFSFLGRNHVSLSDDLNHWALAAKNSFVLNTIAIGEVANTGYQDYPPGTALFQYWLLRLKGQYFEDILFLSMGLFAFSFIIYPLKNVKWRSYKTIVLYAFSGFSFLFAFNIGYNITFNNTLMVDYLLAIIFGYGLLLVFTLKKSISKYTIFNLIITICILPLIKALGIFFAFIIIILAIVNIILTSSNFTFINITTTRAKFLTIFLILFIPFVITTVSWKLLLQFYNVEISGVNNSFYSTLAHFEIPFFAKNVIFTYLQALYNSPVTNGTIKLSYVFFIFLTFTFTYLFWIKEKESRKKILILSLLFGTFLLVFMVGHARMYFGVLSEGESLSLSSFNRYFIYITAGISFAFFGLLMNNSSHKNYQIMASIFMISLSLMVPIDFSTKQEIIPPIMKIQKIKIDNLVEFIKNKIDIKHTTTICLLEGRNGSAFGFASQLQYQLVPLKVVRYSSWVPEKNETSQYWHNHHFKTTIKPCSYLLLVEKNDIINVYYRKYFLSPMKDWALYKIQKQNDENFTFTLFDCTLCEKMDAL